MPDLPEMTLEFTTIETKELLRMRAEIAALKEDRDSETRWANEYSQKLQKAQEQLNAFLSLTERDEKYKYSPADFATAAEWCEVANELASQYRRAIEQRNYWRADAKEAHAKQAQP